MLATRARLQMATVLAGNRISIAALAERTGTDIHLCSAFVQELTQAGVLEEQITAKTPAIDLPTPTKVTPAPKQDLISRIRARFGLSLPVSR